MFLSGNSIPLVSRELTEEEDTDIDCLAIAGNINPLINASVMAPHSPRPSGRKIPSNHTSHHDNVPRK
jgi:hypothetical protein